MSYWSLGDFPVIVMLEISGVHVSFQGGYTLLLTGVYLILRVFFRIDKNLFSEPNLTEGWKTLQSGQTFGTLQCSEPGMRSEEFWSLVFSSGMIKGDDSGDFQKSPKPENWPKRKQFFSGWWQLKHFWNFHPLIWGRWSNLTIIFFRWVETQPPTYFCCFLECSTKCCWHPLPQIIRSESHMKAVKPGAGSGKLRKTPWPSWSQSSIQHYCWSGTPFKTKLQRLLLNCYRWLKTLTRHTK